MRAGSPSASFDWLMIGASLWILAGAYYDSWAHRHLPGLDTFFTPYHAILYSGLLAATLALVGRLAVARLPPGYGLSLVGCLLFGVAGMLDLSWHLVYGIERGLSASLSPTHLLLMLSAGLIVAGPLRASWRSGSETDGWRGAVAAALVLATLTFFGQFDHPFINQWAAAPGPPGNVPHDPYVEAGLFGVLMHTVFITAVLLLLCARKRLPMGAVTAILTLSGVLVTLLNKPDPVIAVAVLAGIIGDIVYQALRPSVMRPVQLRVFAVIVPLVVWVIYFQGIDRFDGIWWPVHVIVGTIVVAGLCRFLVSYLVVPPRGSVYSAEAISNSR